MTSLGDENTHSSNGTEQTLRLVPEDVERLENGETVTFSHVVEGLKITVEAEEIDDD